MTNEKKRVVHLYFNQHKIYAEIAEIEKYHSCYTHYLKSEEETRRKNVDIINSKKRKGEDFVIALPELVPFTSVNTTTSDGRKISDSKK